MSIKLLIRDREHLLVEQEVETLTSFNDVGEFDVLDGHANFITLINQFVVVNKGMEGEQKIPIEKGILSANDNVVEVYVQD